jgi:exopolysaccharide production protein ExoQ
MLENSSGRPARENVDRLADGLAIAVFTALPVVGLPKGPGYAALVFSFAVIQALLLVVGRQRGIHVDRNLVGLAIVFSALCWASVAWSAAPWLSVRAALQTTAVLAAALLVVAVGGPPREKLVPTLVYAMTAAFAVGAILIAVDRALDYPIQLMLGAGDRAATKFNRGIDYYLLILLPVLGYQAIRRRWSAVGILAVASLITVAAGVNTTARVAVPLAGVVLILAFWAPRLVEVGLAVGTVVGSLSLPFLVRTVAQARDMLTPYVKHSGLHRLEIWDYMSARVFENPLFGWGLRSAGAVPVTPEELSRYKFVESAGYYPHNQILQLWVEMGFAGVLIECTFLILVLRLIRNLSREMRPFAYAAFAIAFCVAFTSFQVFTDSWWAALAASAFLFKILDGVGTRPQEGGKPV